MSGVTTPPEPTETPTPEPTPSPTPEPTPTPEPEAPSLINEPEPSAPEPFDAEKLTLPEGFEKNEHFGSFSEWAKEAGISHDAGQKLIDLYTKTAQASSEAVTKAWQEQNAKWQEEVKGDKEVGGENLKSVLQTISKVVDNSDLTDPKFREALDFTGAGNHPAIVRTLARWAKALSEAAPVSGSPPGTAGQRPPPAESLYGPSGPMRGNPRMEN